jgi:phosphatidylserine/phosphatidylglycerophosphate/cardiolipin synthase-like enzyme
MYEFTNPTLAQSLIVAKRKGAIVRVIMDATYKGDNATQVALLRAGIPVEMMHVGSDGYTDIDHVKFLQVDNTLLLGSVNWGSGSGYTTDFDRAFSNAALAKEGQAFFAYDWRQAQSTQYVRDPQSFPSVNGVQLVTDNQIEPAILRVIGQAKKSIQVQMFSFDDTELVDALITAKRRGVTVNVMMDSHYEKYINERVYTKLKEAGVSVVFAPYREVLHSKSAVIDGGKIVIMGSANWTNSGMRYNHELDVIIDRG